MRPSDRSRDSQPRARLSVPKKALFSFLATALFFLVLELVLAASGVRPILYDEDPYVGFSSRIPLFVEQNRPDGQTSLVTAKNKLEWFQPQEFLKDKPAETFRVFCVGGSTTYGRPYNDTTSFCGWLRELLPAADDSRTWQVINAGGISYASYRVAMVMEELIRYEPDLFIVYSGHNEFLERRTYASVLETPSAVHGLGALLSRTRTYSAVKRLVHATKRSDGAPSTRYELSGEVKAVLDETVGPEAYTRDEGLQQQVLAHYRFNLMRMIDIARSVGGRVLLVKPASNLEHCSPFRSEHCAGLGDASRIRWQTLVDGAGKAVAAGQLEVALTALDKAATIDDRHALLHYLRGRVLGGLARHAEAKAAFIRARDEDICPLRALTRMGEIVAEVAAERELPLVDFAALVESHSRHGIPGEDLFLDHVHPTIETNRLLALSLLDEMVSQRIVRPRSSWGKEAIRQVIDRVESQLDHRSHGVALCNLAKVLGWAGKFEESDKLALRAVEMIPADATALYLAGRACARRGDLTRAADYYRGALRIQPGFAQVLGDLGVVFEKQGDLVQAEAHHRRALRLRPDFAQAHYNLGVVLRRRGDLNQAADELQQALRIRPDYAKAHHNLGRVFEQQGDLAKAAACYERAMRIQPDYAQAYNNLGVVFGKQGDLARAALQLEHAIRIQPDYSQAHSNLGRVFEMQGDLQQALSHYRQAFKNEPAPVKTANHIAWVLATSDDASLRNGEEAVQLAEYCARATGGNQPDILNTLAAAYAEAGKFDEAVRWQARAMEIAPADKEIDFRSRLDLYKAGKPYREEPERSPGSNGGQEAER